MNVMNLYILVFILDEESSNGVKMFICIPSNLTLVSTWNIGKTFVSVLDHKLGIAI